MQVGGLESVVKGYYEDSYNLRSLDVDSNLSIEDQSLQRLRDTIHRVLFS